MTKWAVAITTAPRNGCTLKETLASVVACGWEDPMIFAEPDSTPTEYLTFHNEQRLGVWRNWVKSIRHCISLDVDAVLTLQDDVLLHPDSKTFVESIMWPDKFCGFISLYTPKHYSLHGHRNRIPRPLGVNKIYTRSLWGACALVWPKSVLHAVSRHKLIEEWYGAHPRSGNPNVIQKRKADPSLIANSDTAIGKIINSMAKSMWFIDPSPGVHIAEHSTIGHGNNTGRRNAYRIADHSLPLKDQIPNIPPIHKL